MAKPRRPNIDEAATLALRVLGFLAADGDRLTRFIRLTGLSPENLRAMADSPAIQCAVLDHLLSDESLLLTFCAEAGVAPEAIGPALARLAGSPTDRS